MRKHVMLALSPVLALAACGENAGWNPNYSAMHNGSDYAQYWQQREAALHGRGGVPQTIPVQLPAQAPQVVQPGRKVVPATVAVVPANAQPVTAGGPYPGSTPVLVRYARQERQNPGTSAYTRTGGSVVSAASQCSRYSSADHAQRAFIAAGGPILDPRGMDPDGDGYVCGWDPRPLR
ncbi:hypothetical protein [Paracoccus shanxieyensis]|uniref:Excalibur calcium-binding domain-containing protein n=1 Tax=Paracoccus shanxieyensis TaxID=2675752 RepID=A0A6L6IZ80_9RHOB|nr:hypothetical protein [Paracoccus shanxieyensis]MTH64921.1 hypothetical protein [Paracoccus shanxieyensis]MTH88175.1 hypothetical protein [Paracoccus shanxieyensis]